MSELEEPKGDIQLPQLTREEVEWRLTERKALALSRAQGAIPKHFTGKPGDIAAVWLMADELGVSRMGMLRGAYVVNGKPQLSGDLLLAIARGNGVKVTESVRTTEDDESNETTNMVATCVATLPNGEEVVAEFGMVDAMRAGLWMSNDVWKKYPARMLQMRARGWCLRDAIPDKLAGVYSEGELIDVTPVEVS